MKNLTAIILLLLLFVSVASAQTTVKIGNSIQKEAAAEIDNRELYDEFPKSATTIIDRGFYDAFPEAVVTKNTAVMAWKSGARHEAPGNLMIAFSPDGVTWSKPTAIKIDGKVLPDGESITIGAGKNGRLVILFTKGDDNFAQIHSAYNDNLDENFTSGNSVDYPKAPSGKQLVRGAPHGHIKKLPSGRLLACAFAYNVIIIPDQNPVTRGEPAKAYFMKSDDDGATWSNYTTIIDGIIGSSWNEFFTSHGWATEASFELVNDAATDAATKLLIVVRSDDQAHLWWQLYSPDGGKTLINISNQLKAPAFGSFNIGTTLASPVALHRRGKDMYAFFGHRDGTGKNFEIRYFKADAEFIYDKPGQIDLKATELYAPINWGKMYVIYRGLAVQRAAANDFGYPAPFTSPNGQLKVGLYDTSLKSFTTRDEKLTRILSIPVEGQNYLELQGTEMQSISNNTETPVDFTRVWLDTESVYDRISKKIILPHDGKYKFTAKIQFEKPKKSGTATVQIVAVERNNLTVIAEKTINLSLTNPKLNKIGLSATKICKAGQEIKVLVTQNTGAKLDLLNTAKSGVSLTMIEVYD